MKYSCMLAGLLAAVCLAMTAGAQNVSAALDGAISIKSQEAVVDVPVRPMDLAVAWMAAPIRIDGDLADWAASDAKAFRLADGNHATWFKGEYGGGKDFAANVWLGRDYDNLYIGLKIEDDRLPACDRIEVAFTAADTEVIVGWQDVGRRYKADDLHAIFVVKPDDTVGIHLPHLQRRMDDAAVQDSYGSESERRAILEQQGPRSAENRKIFSKVARQTLDGGRSETIVEIALPWSSLLPFDPVAGHPVKMNLAVHDKDGDGLDQVGGALAYTPGLVGVFSGAHFPTLRFDPPKGSKGVAGFAQVPAFHYLNQKIEADVSLRNFGAEVAGKLQLLAAPGREPPLAEREVKIPSGLSAARLAVESEAVGKNRLALMARLVVDGAKPVEFPVFAPRAGNAITIQTLAEIERRVVAFEKDFAALSNLYARVEAAGLDTAYPKAYLTLMKMFLPLCRDNLKRGDSERVVRNTDHLKIVYAEAAAYMEGALRDPARQFKLPPKLVPGTLRIRDGYWRDGDRPVFLWGPCVFWYLKDDQPLVVDLGFNSVCTEVPMRLGATNALIQAHMEYWRTNGVHVNAPLPPPLNW